MKMRPLSSLILGMVMLCLVRKAPAQVEKFSVLYNFGTSTGAPEEPDSPGIISQERDGNLYSTTYSGGTAQHGTVFKITPFGNLTVLYNFGYTQGADPSSGLTLDTNGDLYGTTSLGGTSIYGTLFKVTPTGSLATLYNFTGGNDGGFPDGPPIQGTDGNLYGVVGGAGKFSCGTFYKVHAEKMITLHEFDGKHGCGPASPLILGSDGNFYGITGTGGNADYGVIFKVTPTGHLTVIYRLGRRTGPAYALVLANDGDFYGATTSGGQAWFAS